MILDQGYGSGDLDLNQLKFYLRAVCNAILDHQLHAGNMTDDEAIRLMVDGAFQSRGGEPEAGAREADFPRSSARIRRPHGACADA